jgi:hypothetical protein
MHLTTFEGDIAKTANMTIKFVQPYCQQLYNRAETSVHPIVFDEISDLLYIIIY